MKQLAVFLAWIGCVGALHAAPIEFDFQDPKKVNNVVFQLDAPLESINGTATGISGKVLFDPENPASLKGTLLVSTTTLHVDNPTMKEHLHGAQWMDVANYPEIRFEVTEVRNAKTTGNVTTADLEGKMTIRGVTKTMTVPVKLTYLKDKLKARGGTNRDGDLLVVRSNFSIKRSDFGINAGKNEEKVSNEIALSLSVAGMAPR